MSASSDRSYGERPACTLTATAGIVAFAAIEQTARVESHSVLSALTRAVLDAAEQLGSDTAAVRAEAGLDPAWLDDPDARVPLENHFRMWAVLSRTIDGLALGDVFGVAGLGALGYAMQHGATVAEALDWQQQYRAFVHPGVIPRLERRPHEAGERMVFAHAVPPAFCKLLESVYTHASATVAMMKALTGRPVRAAWITYPLPRPADPARHEQFFACPVAWGAPELEVAFDAALLDLPLPKSDPRLAGYLCRRVDELVARLPAEKSFADRARRQIGALLAQGEARLVNVAKHLAVSERTLHRRLADEGTGFADLVEDARRERASILLEDRSLSASEVGFLLGYAEPAAFFRAFKRWTGQTPESWRKRPAL
jgi:AraC-like DNA-binding protein